MQAKKGFPGRAWVLTEPKGALAMQLVGASLQDAPVGMMHFSF